MSKKISHFYLRAKRMRHASKKESSTKYWSFSPPQIARMNLECFIITIGKIWNCRSFDCMTFLPYNDKPHSNWNSHIYLLSRDLRMLRVKNIVVNHPFLYTTTTTNHHHLREFRRKEADFFRQERFICPVLFNASWMKVE